MSRDKRRRNTDEYLKGQLRHKDKEIKRLKRELSQAVRLSQKLLDQDVFFSPETEATVDETTGDICKTCLKKRITIKLGIKTIIVCETCKTREVINTNN